MKSLLKYTWILLAAGFAFTACSDDDTVDPAPQPTGAQVFFGNELPTAYEINPEENSITVPVSRASTSGAITVPVTATSTAEASKYTVPSEVSFADGEATANLVIKYVPADIEYGNYETITLQLGNSTTPYGYSSYSFSIGVTDWSDWGPFNSAGTATYIYSGTYWDGDDPDLPFVYRQNVIKPNLYQFKISNWGYGVDLVLDYDKETGYVSVARQYTGLADASGYGELYVADYTSYYVYRGYVPGADFDIEYGTFDEEEGIIYIPMNYNVSAGSFGTGDEYIYIGGFTRADVACDIKYAGKFTAIDESVFLVANVTLGADVTSAAVALVPGDVTDEILAQISAGEYEGAVEVAQSGEVKFPAAELADGKYTLVVVSYLNGEARESATDTFKFEAVASAWVSLGMAIYTEDVLGPLYTPQGGNPTDFIATYEVEIQENGDKPGLYRLVNPYGAAYPFNEEGDWDASRDYYLEINATDPTAVFIEAQNMGVDWGDGVFTIYSLGAYYLDKGSSVDEIKEAGAFGKLEDGVITFPAKGILAGLGEDGWYSCNKNEATKIVLPSDAQGAKKSVKPVTRAHGKKVVGKKANITSLLQNGIIKPSARLRK